MQTFKDSRNDIETIRLSSSAILKCFHFYVYYFFRKFITVTRRVIFLVYNKSGASQFRISRIQEKYFNDPFKSKGHLQYEFAVLCTYFITTCLMPS